MHLERLVNNCRGTAQSVVMLREATGPTFWTGFRRSKTTTAPEERGPLLARPERVELPTA